MKFYKPFANVNVSFNPELRILIALLFASATYILSWSSILTPVGAEKRATFSGPSNEPIELDPKF